MAKFLLIEQGYKANAFLLSASAPLWLPAKEQILDFQMAKISLFLLALPFLSFSSTFFLLKLFVCVNIIIATF